MTVTPVEVQVSETKGSKKSAMDAVSTVLNYAKYVFSTVLTLSAISFVCFGIGTGRAVLAGPPVAHYIVLVFVLVLLAYLEGLQVAILALEAQDSSSWKDSHPRAYRLHQLVTRGPNVQRFLVGRQFYVVFVVFLCSQVTTFPTVERPVWFPDFLWFVLVETALPGALIVLAFGQLMPQLIASRHPVVFCNLPGAIGVLYITLFLEAMGVTHFSWLLTNIVSWLSRLGPEGSTPGSAKALSIKSDISKDSVTYDEENPAVREGTSVSGPSPHTAPLLEKLVCIQDEFQKTTSKPDFELISNTSTTDSTGLFLDAATAQAGLEPLGAAGAAQALNSKSAPTPNPHIYPTPREVVEHLVGVGQEVPRFLLPPEHPMHVPPHIVAYSLMAGTASQAVEPASL